MMEGTKLICDTAPTLRQTCLRDAERITAGKRESDYGTPEDCFKRIAGLWNVYLDGAAGGRTQIGPGDVAAMMALVKIARLVNTPNHYDSWVDIAGYAACGAEVSKAEG